MRSARPARLLAWYYPVPLLLALAAERQNVSPTERPATWCGSLGIGIPIGNRIGPTLGGSLIQSGAQRSGRWCSSIFSLPTFPGRRAGSVGVAFVAARGTLAPRSA